MTTRIRVDPARLNVWQYFGQACVACGQVFAVGQETPVVGVVPVECGTREVRACPSCESAALWLVGLWLRMPNAHRSSRTRVG
jgi:hypothetical protein